MSPHTRSSSVRTIRLGVALSDANPVLTSHCRYAAAYVYDIEVHEATELSDPRRFVAQALKMRSNADRSVAVNVELQPEYGATPFVAFSKIEAAVEKWVERQASELAVAHR
jgi:hypothetical protein